MAQSSNTDLRLNKVEAEVRALQRKVFPGSGDKYFTPEITPPSQRPAAGPPPASSALSDVLTRMETLESQVARLTGQVEQNTNRIAQLEAKMASIGQGAIAPANVGAVAAPPAAGTTPPPDNLPLRSPSPRRRHRPLGCRPSAPS